MLLLNFFGHILLRADCSLSCYTSLSLCYLLLLLLLVVVVVVVIVERSGQQTVTLSIAEVIKCGMFCTDRNLSGTLSAQPELLLSHSIQMSDFYTVGPQIALCLRFYPWKIFR